MTSWPDEHTAEALREARDSRLAAKVEGLTIEKIKLGRRTLRRLRWLRAGMALSGIGSVVGMAVCGWLGAPGGLRYGYGLAALLIGAVMLIRYLHEVRKAWVESRREEAARSWLRCERSSGPGLGPALIESLKSWSPYLALALISVALPGIPYDDPLHYIWIMGLIPSGIWVPLVEASMEALQGLHGLCRDTEPKVPAKQHAKLEQEATQGTCA